MQKKLYSIITTVLALAFLSVASARAQAQHEQHGGQKPAAQGEKKDQHQDMSTDMAQMMREPHHALAMAYHESMAVFAKALRQHAEQNNAVNGDFARDALAEVRRDFDQMERHQQEHMKTMTAEMRSQMDAMMKQMEAHHAKIRENLEALEKETAVETPNRARVAELTAEMLKHLDAMSSMHGGHQGHKM